MELYLEDENKQPSKRAGESVSLTGDETRKIAFHPEALGREYIRATFRLQATMHSMPTTSGFLPSKSSRRGEC